jgi:hypothetical protein
LLLLTDGRWRNATGRLVRQIEESGLVPDDQLDLLAQTFLAAGPQVYWEAPGDWFTGPAFVLEPGDPDVPGAVEVIDDDEPGAPEDGPVVFAREVRPPLRRWAAARVVGSDPSCWGAVVQRARQVDPRGGAAIMHGLLDSIGLLTPAAHDLVVDLAESWPQRRVREAATALRHAPPEPAPPAGSGGGSAGGPVASPAPSAPAPSTVQPSLF